MRCCDCKMIRGTRVPFPGLSMRVIQIGNNPLCGMYILMFVTTNSRSSLSLSVCYNKLCRVLNNLEPSACSMNRDNTILLSNRKRIRSEDMVEGEWMCLVDILEQNLEPQRGSFPGQNFLCRGPEARPFTEDQARPSTNIFFQPSFFLCYNTLF